MPESATVVVMVTAPSSDVAERIVREVVAERLAMTVSRLVAAQPAAASSATVGYDDRLLLRLGRARAEAQQDQCSDDESRNVDHESLLSTGTTARRPPSGAAPGFEAGEKA